MEDETAPGTAFIANGHEDTPHFLSAKHSGVPLPFVSIQRGCLGCFNYVQIGAPQFRQNLSSVEAGLPQLGQK